MDELRSTIGLGRRRYQPHDSPAQLLQHGAGLAAAVPPGAGKVELGVDTAVRAARSAAAPLEQAKVISGARLVPLDSANHMLLADEPAWAVFVKELRRFLASQQGFASGTGPHAP